LANGYQRLTQTKKSLVNDLAIGKIASHVSRADELRSHDLVGGLCGGPAIGVTQWPPGSPPRPNADREELEARQHPMWLNGKVAVRSLNIKSGSRLGYHRGQRCSWLVPT